jgi:hypothetical protein
MRVVELSQAEPYAAGNLRVGEYDEKILATGEEGSPDNFRLSYATAVEESSTPRHRHNFEQLRFALAGEFRYGKNDVIPTGWVAYFPESVPYGPQMRSKGTVTLYFQFGPASGAGYMSLRQRRQGYKDLIRKGAFESGAYTYFDESGRKHNRDAFEAVWEQAMDRKLTYAKPRYSGVVLMDPAAFNWVEDLDSHGVAYKWLGSFTERGTRAGFVRLDKGATLTIDPKHANHILFLVTGALSSGGRRHPPHTAFNLAVGSEPTGLTAEEASELYCIQLPPLSAALAQAKPSDVHQLSLTGS